MDKLSDRVHIMLATYNGDKYLSAQLDSILAQTYANWVVYISDDGSTDKTVEIIERYLKQYPGKFALLPRNKKSMGAKGNFSYLFSLVDKADYYMFCDQDDIWKNNKIEVMINEFKRKEKSNKYLLVYHDLELIDSKDNLISVSFTDYSGLKLRSKKVFSQILLYNCIPGCAMAFNDNVKELVGSIPQECFMHDWWITLVVLAFDGKVMFLNDKLGAYRQHELNEVGAYSKKINVGIISKIIKFKKIKQNNDRMKKDRIIQSEKILIKYQDSLPIQNNHIIVEYLRILKGNYKLRNLVIAYKNGLVLWNWFYTLKFYLL